MDQNRKFFFVAFNALFRCVFYYNLHFTIPCLCLSKVFFYLCCCCLLFDNTNALLSVFIENYSLHSALFQWILLFAYHNFTLKYYFHYDYLTENVLLADLMLFLCYSFLFSFIRCFFNSNSFLLLELLVFIPKLHSVIWCPFFFVHSLAAVSYPLLCINHFLRNAVLLLVFLAFIDRFYFPFIFLNMFVFMQIECKCFIFS